MVRDGKAVRKRKGVVTEGWKGEGVSEPARMGGRG